MTRIALWGGIECTVNRVGDTFFDQVERTGHGAREEDIERMQALGLEAVRYPLLWERMADALVTDVDFSWADRRMARIRACNMQPICGLVHHGSGPRGTSLLDPSFPLGLARFAEHIARRYPWVTMFTPVNEPLTTARFSALYGHWYPHARSDRAFVSALMNQIRATRNAMAAIRRHIPEAALVQTEDIGTVHASPAVQYQADFENERRWLSLDLLTGRVQRQHPLWGYLTANGVHPSELDAFCECPCPPSVAGVNYYVTSDRYLDERVESYPDCVRGSNGRHAYADVEAARACRDGIVGHANVLEQIWRRYGLPVALTEVHLGCHPEEQLRWLRDAWQGAHEAAARGADVRAITPWSLFGAFDWDSLVTFRRDHYECGAFDIRPRQPAPTAVARAVVELANHGAIRHPLASSSGWWKRPERLIFSKAALFEVCGSTPAPAQVGDALPPVVIVGAEGPLGQSLMDACACRSLPTVGLGSSFARVERREELQVLLRQELPWLVVCCVTIKEPHVAAACHAVLARFVCFSSAHVFKGDRATGYTENDDPDPCNTIGAAHASAEHAARAGHPEALVFRLGALYGSTLRRNVFARGLEALKKGERLAVPSARLSVSHAPEVAHACLNLAVAGTTGIVHLTNEGVVSLRDWMHHLCAIEKISSGGLVASQESDFLGHAWPQNAVLSSHRAAPLDPLECVLPRGVPTTNTSREKAA